MALVPSGLLFIATCGRIVFARCVLFSFLRKIRVVDDLFDLRCVCRLLWAAISRMVW